MNKKYRSICNFINSCKADGNYDTINIVAKAIAASIHDSDLKKEALEYLKELEELAKPKQYEFRRIKASFNTAGSSQLDDKDEYVLCSIYCDGKHICDVEWHSYGNQGHVSKWPYFVNRNNKTRFISILKDFLRTSEVYYDVF